MLSLKLSNQSGIRPNEAGLRNESHDWHTYDFEEVLNILNVDENGLTHKEVIQIRAQYGSNEFSKAHTETLFERFFAQFKSPLVLVLVLAFILTAVLKEYVDASVILFALLIAVTVGVLQEGKASRAFKKLKDSQVKMATVLRDGGKHVIEARELVPGDIVEIQSGGQVPADLRFIKTKKLSINEAALTGEWLSEAKSTLAVPVGTPLAERVGVAYMGTFVAVGYGIGVVIATGNNTAVGELAATLDSIDDVETPLQYEMRKISRVMLTIIGLLVLGIFVIGLLGGQTLHDMLLMSIAIAVAAVPEGLPAAVTIILAVGMEALLKRGGLVRNLLAAETLGSTTYVLTDKTGTLTEARMAVTGVILHGDTASISAEMWRNDIGTRRLFDIALCASDAYLDVKIKEEGESIYRGDPVEKSILEAAKELGIDADEYSLRNKRFDYIAFTSDNRFAAGLTKEKNGRMLCINGAPDLLLQKASYVHTKSGCRSITEKDRTEFKDAIREHTSKGKRLVAVGYNYVEYDDIPEEDDEVLDDLVFEGVMIFDDPVRKGVPEAIKGVKEAGAKVILITGDNPETALSIAQMTGIAEDGSRALTGSDLEKLSDEELIDVLDEVSVFARVLPRQKLRITEILQAKGEIVAMTGDGINDAPALRRANIGISIGSGTEVAKEASDLVLVNDTFATIYAAIEEGRRITANLRKIVGYLLSTSLSEVVLIGSALIIGAPIPILPAQILWANVIEEGLMSVAFAFEKGEKGAMKRRPQDIHEEGILSREMMLFMAFVITVLGTLTVTLYFYLRSLQLPLEELRSAMFLSISIDSLFIAFSFRSLTTPIWKIPLRSNIFFIGAFLLSTLLLIAAVTVPFLQFVLSYTPLPLFDILLVLGFSAVALVTVEVSKWLFFERRELATE